MNGDPYIPPVPKPLPRARTPKPLQRTKGIAPVNPERRAERFERDYGPLGFASWVRTLACVVSGEGGSESDPVVAAHVKSRGAGGDWRSIVPMKQSLHDRLHTMGIDTFETHFEVDLQMAADAVQLRWRQFTKSEIRADGLHGSGA